MNDEKVKRELDYKLGVIYDKGDRERNEDAIFCNNMLSYPVFAVFDGMGGCSAGDLASNLALNIFNDIFNDIPLSEILNKWERRGLTFSNEGLIRIKQARTKLEKAVLLANEVISHINTLSHLIKFEINFQNIDMGTTVAAVQFFPNYAEIVNIGDSSIYFLDAGAGVIKKVSEDDAIKRGGRDYLTQYIGMPTEKLKVHFKKVEYEEYKDNIVLLCTDGLTKYLSDNEINKLLLVADNPLEASSFLFTKIKSNKTREECEIGEKIIRDNVASIIIDFSKKEDKELGKMAMRELGESIFSLEEIAEEVKAKEIDKYEEKYNVTEDDEMPDTEIESFISTIFDDSEQEEEKISQEREVVKEIQEINQEINQGEQSRGYGEEYELEVENKEVKWKNKFKKYFKKALLTAGVIGFGLFGAFKLGHYLSNYKIESRVEQVERVENVYKEVGIKKFNSEKLEEEINSNKERVVKKYEEIKDIISKINKREWLGSGKPKGNELELKVINGEWNICGMKNIDFTKLYLRITSFDGKVSVYKFRDCKGIKRYIEGNKPSPKVKWAEVVELSRNNRGYQLKVHATYEGKLTKYEIEKKIEKRGKSEIERKLLEDEKEIKHASQKEMYKSNDRDYRSRYGRVNKGSFNYSKKDSFIRCLSIGELEIIKDTYFNYKNEEALEILSNIFRRKFSKYALYMALDELGEREGKVYRKRLKN